LEGDENLKAGGLSYVPASGPDSLSGTEGGNGFVGDGDDMSKLKRMLLLSLSMTVSLGFPFVSVFSFGLLSWQDNEGNEKEGKGVGRNQ
jgi:hypothetical protein